jgi:Amt family ammonium transporter
MDKFLKYSGLGAGLSLLSTLPALAQEATDAATETVVETAEVVTDVMDKGDVAWMLISTALVLFMILPGLALFYGGLVRAKNMLSLLVQSTVITALVIVIYVFWGYSMSFGDAPSAFWAGSGRRSCPA